MSLGITWNNKTNQLYIPSNLKSDYIIKIPTVKNRRAGTLSFDSFEFRDFLESDKKAIIYVNPAKREIAIIPKELIVQHKDEFQVKDFNGVKNMLVVVPFKELMAKYEIKYQSAIEFSKEPTKDSSLAGQIKAKFGI